MRLRLAKKIKAFSVVPRSLQLAEAGSKLSFPSSDMLGKDHQHYKFSDECQGSHD